MAVEEKILILPLRFVQLGLFLGGGVAFRLIGAIDIPMNSRTQNNNV